MSDSADRRYLNTFALSIHQKFNPTGLNSLELLPVKTGGWKVALASWPEPVFRFEVWFDRFPGGPSRRLWYGVFSQSRDALQRLAMQLPDDLRPRSDLGLPKVITHPFRRNWQTKLPESAWDRVVLEHYKGFSAFFGVYCSAANPPGHRGYAQLIDRVVSLFKAVSSRLPNQRVTTEVMPISAIIVPLHDNLGEIYSDNLEEVGREYQDNPGGG
jgi:hypothetical protein